MKSTNVLNGIDTDALTELIGNVRRQPELGASRFLIKNRWIEGGHNKTVIQEFYSGGKKDESRSTPFMLDADEPPMLLGENYGPNPVEYVLTALAACLTSTMVYHAAARGIRIAELESEVEGDIDLRGFMGIDPDVKKGYQNIRVNFRVASDASPEKLEELAKFSPVYDTVTSPVPVTINIEKKQAEHLAREPEEAMAGAPS